MFKRIFLFIAVNMLVMATISITLAVFRVGPYLTPYGIDYAQLLAFCAIVGFVGAFISLMMSKFFAKLFMGVRVIDPSRAGSQAEKDLVQLVHRLAQKAGLPKMPEVGIYDSPEVNAFATGPSKSSALVAVSAGLLQSMDREAVEGVLGHEIAHVANGDMVTMTLIQGVVNTFVMFFARIVAWGVTQAMAGNRDDREGSSFSPMIHWVCVMVFEILFSLFGAMVVAYFSRIREFRADKGGANLAGKEKMIHALQSLKRNVERAEFGDANPAVASLKISSRPKGFLAMLATHPSLDTRIEALRAG